MAPPPSLQSKYSTLLSKREFHNARRRLTLAADDSIDFSSNDFLSLSHDEDLRSAYLAEFKRLFTSSTALGNPLYSRLNPTLGSTGSRLLDGNSPYAEKLERDIASFHNAPTGLLFNSGYAANSGIFSCLPQHGDVVVYDEYIHASVHEGMRLSRAKICLAFNHNSVRDFESVISRLVRDDINIREGRKEVFVAVESVYSMDGDVCPLAAFHDLLSKYLVHNNGHLIVDEAHATGVFGREGRGLVSLLGLESKILVRLHTFGKAMASGGAIVLCDEVVRDYLINYAKSLIYTTALGLPTLAMVRSVYDFTISGRARERQAKLWTLINHLHIRLKSLMPSSPLPRPHTEALILYTSAEPTSPIFSLLTSRPRDLASHCQRNRFVVRPIVPPTVPAGGERVRVCLHSGNTFAEVDGLVECIRSWASQQQPAVIETEVGDGDMEWKSRL